MAHQLINEYVDIYQLPAVDPIHKGTARTQITIGDLHANAMKLLFVLIKHGIATNISEEEYLQLVAIYKTPTDQLTRGILNKFENILDNMEFNADSFLRLIGDELGDRGSNDYFILLILKKLNQHNVPIEILLSNHGVEFIEATEQQAHFYPPMLRYGHAASMERLNQLVTNGVITREEVLDIANSAHKPNLRLISYSLSEDEKEITIYSHAGIGLNNIKKFAGKLHVPYNDATAVELANTIDEINRQFQKHVQNNTVHTLYARVIMEQGYEGNRISEDAPLEFTMWNRFYNSIVRPFIHNNYRINFVHGHDSHDPTAHNIYNLDEHNLLGKALNYNQETYTALYSQVVKRALQITAITTPIHQAINAPKKNPASPTMQALYKTIESQLSDILNKVENLRDRGFETAADEAFELHYEVNSFYNRLVLGTMTPKDFRDQSIESINATRLELEHHRGWKEILGNLALAIAGLGVLYVAAGLINKAVTGNFLFFQTDSEAKVNNLEKTIESVANLVN